MFNLLSEKEQRLVKSEYSRRRLVIILLFIFVTAVTASVFLAPAYFVGKYRLQEMKQTADILEGNIAIANKQSLSATVSIANQKIGTIEKEPAQRYTEIINTVSSLKLQEIKINSFSMKQTFPMLTLTVKGKAATREGLLEFANKLKQNPDFKKVDLPISNFAKESNIDFTLIITAQK